MKLISNPPTRGGSVKKDLASPLATAMIASRVDETTRPAGGIPEMQSPRDSIMSKQTQVTVSKTPRAATVRKGRKATAPVAPVETAPVATEEAAPTVTEEQAPAPRAIAFYINNNRPGAGERLYAHTAAFLALSGLRDGKAIPVETARKVIGETAVKYHTHKTGAFEITKEGLRLAKPQHFDARGKLRADLVEAYERLLSEGAESDVAKVPAKDISALKAKAAQ